ncbi:MAG: asparaginase domain-containing protein [Candidatus Neomarinimicrobiota bacterium]
MSICIFITGGTFDKEYDEINGRLYFKKTHMREMLQLGRSRLDVNIYPLMLKDSLEMTDKDRQKILQSCRRAKENKIIITHGTDRMTKTAGTIAAANLNKTILLTGAMIPYKFGSSDGLFNLGSALAFAQTLPPGVFIAMNGRWFNYNTVEKNQKTGIFEVKSKT